MKPRDQNRTTLKKKKTTLSQWSSCRQETACCCSVIFRHFLRPRLLHMGESRCRFIQITWYSWKEKRERKKRHSRRGSGGYWVWWRTTHRDQTPHHTASEREPSGHATARVSLLLLLTFIWDTPHCAAWRSLQSGMRSGSYLVESVV